MPSFDRICASSPILAIQPQAVHQMPFGNPFLSRHDSTLSHTISLPPQLVRSSSVAGRKRSRDEASVNLDPPEKLIETPVIKESEDEWIYGPGMTLIKKSSGYVADATSQSGTWVEEKAAAEDARRTEEALVLQEQLAQERPSLRSHKSQRLEMTTQQPANEGGSSRRSSPAREVINPMTASSDSIAQPIVDDFTFHLGIGWSRISDDKHIQAAARGWARFIENHYPVTNAKIRLESRGLQSYLVEADEGYFLFAENLRHGRLVSATAERALGNLKCSPPVFDGLETMDAAEMPRVLNSAPNLAPPPSLPTASVDMDMS